MPAGFNKEVLRRRIVKAREDHGIKQTELAEKSGVTPAAISQIEKGHRTPTIPVLHRIANVLGVSIDFLIGKTDNSELQDLLQHEDFKTFYRGYEALTQDDKEIIKKHIEFLKSQKNSRKEK